jgi:hypothetical protein
MLSSVDVYVVAWTKCYSVRVRVRVTLRLMVSQSVCLGVKPLPGLITRYLFLIEKLQSCPNGAPSLTRGQVCYLSVSHQY